MLKEAKDFIKNILNSILGLIVGITAYIGFYYYNNLFIKAILLSGLFFLCRIWLKPQYSTRINAVKDENTNIDEEERKVG